MRRWLIPLIAAGIVISAIVVRSGIRAAAKRRRETGYTGALKAYSDALHPGMTPKDVDLAPVVRAASAVYARSRWNPPRIISPGDCKENKR